MTQSSSVISQLQYVHVPLILGRPAPDTALQMWPHQCRGEGKDHRITPLTCWQYSPWCCPGDCWPSLLQEYIAGSCLVWCSPRPKSFCKASFPSLYWCTGVFILRYKTLQFSLLNFLRSLFAIFSTYLACTSSVCPWGCYWRKCWKPAWSQNKRHPSSQSFDHRNPSGWSGMTSPP